MKIIVDDTGEKTLKFTIPRWLYMNTLGISILALRKNVPFTPKQGRKAVRAVKKAMKESNINSIAEIEIDEKETKIRISV